MILQNRLKVFRAILNVNQQEMGRLCGVSRANDQPDRARRLFAVRYTCSDDRKGMRRYG